MPGPPPKRSEERIRRNEPDVPIEIVPASGTVEIPKLQIPYPHPLVQSMWDSLAESAQARFYEPSDWAYAKLALYFANELLHQQKPSAQLLMTVNSMLSDLLVSEGQRRRVRMEIERNPSGAGEVFDAAAMFAKRASGK